MYRRYDHVFIIIKYYCTIGDTDAPTSTVPVAPTVLSSISEPGTSTTPGICSIQCSLTDTLLQVIQRIYYRIIHIN